MKKSGLIRLAAGGDRAEISKAGGELVGWRVAGKNLLWTADPKIWARTSPILFPIVGRACNGEISVDGRKYRMGIHGFASGEAFTLVATSEDAVCLRLEDNPATRAIFPFSFRLDVTYRLAARRLAVGFDVTNTGDARLPYALGWHPGFAWPFSTGRRDQYSIVFERPEQAEVPAITPDGLFSAKRKPLPIVDRTLPLTDDLLAHEALCLVGARSQSLRFVAPDGAAIRLEVQDFPHIALWSRPPASFLCIEAWTGHGDPEGFAGDISAKPWTRFLPPGAKAEHGVRVIYEEASG